MNIMSDQSQISYITVQLFVCWQDNNLSVGLSTQLHTRCPPLTFLTFNRHVKVEAGGGGVDAGITCRIELLEEHASFR